jgi:hypothetical protein
MTPGPLDLPIIYRGSTWPTVIITFINKTTLIPLDFTGYRAFAHIKHLPTETLIYDLLPVVTDAVNGKITIPPIPKLNTEKIPAGSWRWDLLLESSDSIISGPWLSGNSVVSDIITNPIHP